MTELYQTLATHKKQLFFFFISGLVVYGYYLFSNAYWMDDYNSMTYYPNPLVFWHTNGSWSDGRPMANVFYYLFAGEAGWPFMGAMRGVVALVLYAVLVVLLLNHYQLKISYFTLFLSLIFIFNPFTLKTLLYRFDAMGMALSLLLACLPLFIPYSPKKKWPILATGWLLLFCSFATYQLAISGFITLVVLNLILNLVKNKSIKKGLSEVDYYFAMFIVPVVAYFLLIKLNVIHGGRTDFYAGPLSIPLTFFNNVITLIQRVSGLSFLLALCWAGFSFVAILTTTAFLVYKGNYSQKKRRVLLLTLTLPALLLSPLIFILLNTQAFLLSARYAYTTSILFVLALVAFWSYIETTKLKKMGAVVLSYFILFMAFQTAISVATVVTDSTRTHDTALLLSSDLNRLGQQYPINKVFYYFDGQPIIHNVILHQTMVTSYLTHLNFSYTERVEVLQPTFILLSNTPLYKIYYNEEDLALIVQPLYLSKNG